MLTGRGEKRTSTVPRRIVGAVSEVVAQLIDEDPRPVRVAVVALRPDGVEQRLEWDDATGIQR